MTPEEAKILLDNLVKQYFGNINSETSLVISVGEEGELYTYRFVKEPKK